MDYLYFLRERLNFIRSFYERSSAPFRLTMAAIEAGEPPFDDPPYDESGEPPYQVEWSDASEALEVSGRIAISMLSGSLQLYFKAREREIGMRWEKGERERLFKDGFVHGYRRSFEEVLGVPWTESTANLDILEQIVLARNRDQHPDDLLTMSVSHAPKDWEKFRRPFFARPEEAEFFAEADEFPRWWGLSIHVSAEHVETAIAEVEKIVVWLDETIRQRRPWL